MSKLMKKLEGHDGAVMAALAVLCLLLPLLVRNAYHLHLLTLIFLYCILALGLNLIVGCAGLLNLGYAAFYGIGAYTTALLSVKAGMPFWVCLPASVLMAVAAGIVVGLPALRLRGDYLAIVTLGFGEIFHLVVRNWDGLTEGPRGISGIAPAAWGGAPFHGIHAFYYLALVLALLTLFVNVRLMSSWVGRAWIAIREDEVAAELMGVDTTSMKLLAFGLSSAFAGLAGCLFAVWFGYVSPESFKFTESLAMAIMVILGGMGSIPGVLLGAVIMVLLPELLRGAAQWRELILGAALVAIILFRPQGLVGNWRRARELSPETERIKEEEDESIFEDRKK